MKRLISIMLAMLLLTACTAPQGTSPTEPGQLPIDPTDPPPTDPAGITVVVSEDGCSLEAWQRVCDAFTKLTGVDVQLTTEDTVYADVLQVDRIPQNVQAADVTAVLNMTIPGETGKVQDKLMADLAQRICANPWSLPVFYDAWALGYNPELFSANGWSMPKSMEEFWALRDKASAKNIPLLTYERHADLDGLLYSLLTVAGGEEFFLNAISYGDGVWTSEEGKACAKNLYLMAYSAHKLTPSQVGTGKNEKLVLQKKALFLPVKLSTLSQVEGFIWGLTGLPASDSSGYYVPVQAKRVVLNRLSSEWEHTKMFAAFLYSDTACQIFAQEGLLQPVKGSGTQLHQTLLGENARVILGQFAAYEAVAGMGSIRQVFLAPMDQLVNGTITWEEWIARVNHASHQMKDNMLP
jgi:N-acetylglucosamine transport system substrate-binding protein